MSETLEIDAGPPGGLDGAAGWTGSISVEGGRMRVWLPLRSAARELVDEAVRRAGQTMGPGGAVYPAPPAAGDDDPPF